MKIFLLLIVFLTGCTHDYHGRQPDFHKEGDAASLEYEHFKIHEFHHQRSTVGRENGIRTKTLVPLLKDVSPKAHLKYRNMGIERTVHTGLTAVMWIMVGVFILSQPNFPGGYALAASGVVLGHSIYMDGHYQEVKKQYNQDLNERLTHQKIAPQLGYSWKF